MPLTEPYTPAPISPRPDAPDPVLVAAEQDLYSANCALCHNQTSIISRGLFPDLRRSARLHSREAFDAVVLHGALSENGMAGFGHVLDEAK